MSYKTIVPINVHGHWNFKVHGPNGELKEYRELEENVVTTNGKSLLATFLSSAAAAATTWTVRYIGIGTGSTAETVSDVQLATESNRVSGIVSNPSAGVYVSVGTFAAGVATGTIVEYGLFNTATTGSAGTTMFSRLTSSGIAKGASDTLTVTTRVTFS